MHSKSLSLARKTEDEKRTKAEEQVSMSELAMIVAEKETKSNLMQVSPCNKNKQAHTEREMTKNKNKRVIQIDKISNSKHAQLNLANKWN